MSRTVCQHIVLSSTNEPPAICRSICPYALRSLREKRLETPLRGGRVASVLIGASKPGQIDDCVGALKSPELSPEELARIDEVLSG